MLTELRILNSFPWKNSANNKVLPNIFHSKKEGSLLKARTLSDFKASRPLYNSIPICFHYGPINKPFHTHGVSVML